jgi:hypothetical protein
MAEPFVGIRCDCRKFTEKKRPARKRAEENAQAARELAELRKIVTNVSATYGKRTEAGGAVAFTQLQGGTWEQHLRIRDILSRRDQPSGKPGDANGGDK